MKKNWLFTAVIVQLLFILFIYITLEEPETTTALVTKKIMFGIDVSEYQSTIYWDTVVAQQKFPIGFTFIRATMGKDRKDAMFAHNWEHAKRLGLIVGAYHFYDPKENSIEQASNYLRTVHLQKGDIVPIVDIERLSKIQTPQRLCVGLRRWLDTLEKVYGVKPMLYSGCSFFNTYLLKEFSGYPMWIAAYSGCLINDPLVTSAAVHQFTDRLQISGIRGPVDGDSTRCSMIDSLRIH